MCETTLPIPLTPMFEFLVTIGIAKNLFSISNGGFNLYLLQSPSSALPFLKLGEHFKSRL